MGIHCSVPCLLLSSRFYFLLRSLDPFYFSPAFCEPFLLYAGGSMSEWCDMYRRKVNLLLCMHLGLHREALWTGKNSTSALELKTPTWVQSCEAFGSIIFAISVDTWLVYHIKGTVLFMTHLVFHSPIKKRCCIAFTKQTDINTHWQATTTTKAKKKRSEAILRWSVLQTRVMIEVMKEPICR